MSIHVTKLNITSRMPKMVPLWLVGWSLGSQTVTASAKCTFKNDYDELAESLIFSATAFRLARIDR